MLAVSLARKPAGAAIQPNEMYALSLRGPLGNITAIGHARAGLARAGSTNNNSGIYQRRNKGYNNHGYNPSRPRTKYYVRMRQYRPTNPRTPLQQANRAKMADAVAAWQSLTEGEKVQYREQGKTRRLTGYMYFCSNYLKTH